MEDTGTHHSESTSGLVNSLFMFVCNISRWFDSQECMCDMCWIVNWKPDSNHDVHDRNTVKSHIPEWKKPEYKNINQDDAKEHEYCNDDVCGDRNSDSAVVLMMMKMKMAMVIIGTKLTNFGNDDGNRDRDNDGDGCDRDNNGDCDRGVDVS